MQEQFDCFISCFKQVIYVIMRGKKLVSSVNIIGLSIFASYCRSFTKIRKGRGPRNDPCRISYLIFFIFFAIGNKGKETVLVV